MSAVLGTEFSGGVYIKSAGGEEEFRIYDLDVVISNASFAQSDTEGDRFVVESTLVLQMPIYFCGNALPNLKINIRTTAGYTPIFIRVTFKISNYSLKLRKNLLMLVTCYSQEYPL